MTKRIQKAIDIFLDAINNGTLAKGTCTACAVGNLVAHGINYTPMIQEDRFAQLPNSRWGVLFSTSFGIQEIFSDCNANEIIEANNNIKATDFNFRELRAIEKAFENNTEIFFSDYCYHTKEEIRADQIKGLEAVVKVMLEFDSVEEDVKKVFTERAELITV